jgi:hypothetical protein
MPTTPGQLAKFDPTGKVTDSIITETVGRLYWHRDGASRQTLDRASAKQRVKIRSNDFF